MKKWILLVVTVVMMLPLQAEAKGKNAFEKMDTNGDGMVSEQEYVSHVQAQAKKRFAKKDKNGDGMLSKDEARQKMKDDKKDNKSKKKDK